MPSRTEGRRYAYTTVDAIQATAYPVAAVALFTVLGWLSLSIGITNHWYYTPYALIVALAANRICLQSGLICAILAALTHEYAFAGERWSWEWPTIEQAITYASLVVVAAVVARRDPVPLEPAPGLSSGDALPFEGPASSASSGDDAKPRRFWMVEPSGVWSCDSNLGAEYGRIYVDRLRSRGDTPLLCWIVADMIRRGTYTGVEAGFLGAVGRAARDPASPLLLRCDSLSTEHDSDQVQA